MIVSILTISYLTTPYSISAQVSGDGTVQTQVTSDGNQLAITGGTEKGNNLFHSFSQFSIPNNIEAYFNNSENISNIISRVTGGSISHIEGMIRANGTANLFLINPNGITFGPNAQIDIGGSFLASTAESINFADGVQFSATNTQPNPLLTVAVPVGLQFGSNPGNILVNKVSNLKVTPGNTFALVGGEINFVGSGNLFEGIQVRRGRIELGSVGSNSTVQITEIERGFQLSYKKVENFQDILLSEGFQLIDGFNSTIQIQGRKIKLQNNAQIASITESSEEAGDIIINASESVELIGVKTQDLSGQQTGLFAQVDSDVTGRGGNIIINTRQLTLRDGSTISSDVRGLGQGGSVEINASESVDLIGTGFLSPSLLSSSTLDSGNGGEVIINTKQLTLQDGGQILAATATPPGSVANTGQGGTITINASQSIQVSGSSFVPFQDSIAFSRISTESGFTDLGFLGFASGGNLNINTNQLSVIDGGVISAGSLGFGQAGNIEIKANSIFLDNQGSLTAASEGTGNAGNLTLETNQLTVNNQSEVAVRSIGFGQGGNLTINAQSISVDNNSQLTAASEALDLETAETLGIDLELLEFNEFSGNAGSLNITTDDLTLNHDSEVTVSSFGLGDAGDLTVRAQNLFLDNNSRLSAETASGEGGNISLEIDRFLTLRHSSQISTTAGIQGGRGNGGNIDLNALFIIAVPSENSDIIANAFLGNGGNISIDAAGVFGIEERVQMTPLSDITASSQFGQVGNVGINRPDVDPQRSLVRLPAELVDTNDLIVDACSPGGALTRGEFTITGRGGLPSNPNEGVETPTGLTELGYPNNNLSVPDSSQPRNQAPIPSSSSLHQRETHTQLVVEAQGWITNAEGNVVLTAQPPSVTPNSSGFQPATCYDFSKRNLSP